MQRLFTSVTVQDLLMAQPETSQCAQLARLNKERHKNCEALEQPKHSLKLSLGKWEVFTKPEKDSGFFL